MNKRPVDRTKKSNIKCEHCDFWKIDEYEKGTCTFKDEEKKYYQRCKDFKWKE